MDAFLLLGDYLYCCLCVCVRNEDCFTLCGTTVAAVFQQTLKKAKEWIAVKRNEGVSFDPCFN